MSLSDEQDNEGVRCHKTVNDGIQKLVAEHQAMLRFYILKIYPNQDATDDILQETNRIIWSKRSEFDPGTNFLAWARAIAKFQTLSYLKKRTSKSWLNFDSELVEDLAQKIEQNEEHAEARKVFLMQCIQSLNPKDRDLVVRKYNLGQTHKEISHETGRSEGGLKQAFMRIRHLLRTCVQHKIASSEAELQ